MYFLFDHLMYFLFDLFAAVVSNPARDPLHLPHLQLLVDAVRRHLPPHRAGVGFRIGKDPAALHAGPGLGHPSSDDVHLRTSPKHTREDGGRDREVSCSARTCNFVLKYRRY
jgi:hypothetical protein